MMEGHQVLQGVCIHNKEAAIIQAHCQGFAIGREAAATAACGGQWVCYSAGTGALPVRLTADQIMDMLICLNGDSPFLSLRTASMQWLGERSHMRRVLSSLTVAQRGRWG